jgi:hypothetical protein
MSGNAWDGLPIKAIATPAASELQRSSIQQGGRGVALRQQTSLSQLGTPIVMGQSPGPGTACSAFLKTGFDPAYNNAQVDFVVLSFGRTVIYESVVLTPLLVASQDSLELSATGCAADFWQVQITLNNGSQPAAMLQSSIVATGVENVLGEGETEIPPYFAPALGPGAAGSFAFGVPLGTSIYQVTAIARVTHAGGGGEAVGDSDVKVFDVAFSNVGGVVTLVPPVAAPNQVFSNASMVATTFVAATTGAAGEINYTLPGTLDAGTLVNVTIKVVELGQG